MRRALGAFVMVAGAAAIMAMVAFTIVVLAGYIRAGKALDAASMLAALTIPGIIAGILMMVIGRWIYGDWTRAAPIANTTSSIVRTAGILVAIALGAALVFLLVTGFQPDDTVPAILLGLGTIAGILLVILGIRIRGSGRSYLD